MQSEDKEPVCRVCRTTGEPQKPLYFPCKCSGSMKYVHQGCLETWLLHSHKKECEICRHRFAFESLYSHDLKAGVTRLLILKVALLEALVLFNQLGKALLAVLIWIFITPYCARCFWIFYFDPSSFFKFFNAILCKFISKSCAVLLVITQNPNLLEIFPSLVSLSSLFLGVNPRSTTGVSSSSTSSASTGTLDLVNTIKANPSQGASKYLLDTLSNKLSFKSIAYDILCGQAVTLGVLLSVLTLTFIREHISFDTLTESGIEEQNLTSGAVSLSSSPYSNYDDDDFLEEVSDIENLAIRGANSDENESEGPYSSENPQGDEHPLGRRDDVLNLNEFQYSQDGQISGTFQEFNRPLTYMGDSDIVNRGENIQNDINHTYLTGMRGNIDAEHESEFSTILGVLGVNGSLPNLMKNFFFTNVVIATFIGGVIWMPCCFGSLVVILFKDIYIPFFKYLISAVFGSILYLVNATSVIRRLLQYRFLMNVLNFLFKHLYVLKLLLFKSSESNTIDVYSKSQNLNVPVESVIAILEGDENFLDNAFRSISVDNIQYSLDKILNSVINGFSRAEHITDVSISPISTYAVSNLNNTYSTVLVRAGGVATMILIKKIMITMLILFHVRRTGWAQEFQRTNNTHIVRKSLKVITRSLEIALGFFLSMIILPIVYGIIADVLTLPVFGPTATIKSRWKFFVDNPLTSRFIHWIVGTTLMSNFVYYFSAVRSSLSPGVLWFIKDPIYPRRGMSEDLVKQPFLSKMNKTLFSAILYACAIIVCLGGFVVAMHLWDKIFSLFTKGGGPTQILPLQWDFSDTPFIFPIDLIFFYFFAVKIVRKYKPLDKLNLYVLVWLFIAGRALRISDFLLGFKQYDEELDDGGSDYDDTAGNERDIVKKDFLRVLFDRLFSLFSNPTQKREYKYMRIPANDNVITKPGEPIYLPVKSSNDTMYLNSDDNKNNKSRNWRIVYTPPNFKTRIVSIVLFNWLFNVFLLLIFSATSLVLGRYAFNITFRVIGRLMRSGSIFNTSLRISTPAQPMVEYFKSNDVSFIGSCSKISHIHKSVGLSLLIELKDSKKNITDLLKGKIGAVDHIMHNTNSIYGISNYALVNRPLWNRVVRPDIAIHDTYSFFVGIHICVLAYRVSKFLISKLHLISGVLINWSKLLTLCSTVYLTRVFEAVLKFTLKILTPKYRIGLGGSVETLHQATFNYLKRFTQKVKDKKRFIESYTFCQSDIVSEELKKFTNTIDIDKCMVSTFRFLCHLPLLLMRIAVFITAAITIPTLAGMAFEISVLGLLNFILHPLRKNSSVLSLAKIPESWLKTKSSSELFTYVVTNEWAFGAILINTLYMIKRSRTPGPDNQSISELLSAKGLIGDLQPLFLRVIVTPVFLTCVSIIFTSSLCKLLVSKILYPWIAIIQFPLFITRTGNYTNALRCLCKTLESLKSDSVICNTNTNKFEFTFFFIISLILFVSVVVFGITVICISINRHFKKINIKAHNQVYLIGYKLHNYEPQSKKIKT